MPIGSTQLLLAILVAVGAVYDIPPGPRPTPVPTQAAGASPDLVATIAAVVAAAAVVAVALVVVLLIRRARHRTGRSA